MTDGDRAECKEIARQIIKEVLTEHIQMCPYGLFLAKGKAFFIGICIGSGALGSGVSLAIAKALNAI